MLAKVNAKYAAGSGCVWQRDGEYDLCSGRTVLSFLELKFALLCVETVCIILCRFVGYA